MRYSLLRLGLIALLLLTAFAPWLAAADEHIPSRHNFTSPDQSVYLPGSADIIPLGNKFLSPDHKFTIKICKNGYYNRYFIIRNETTEKEIRINASNNPVYFLKWSPDSKTILAVEHFAQASAIQLLHYSDGKWSQSLISPVDCWADHVINWAFLPGKIRVLDIYDDRGGPHDRIISFHECIFDVNPASGETTLVKIWPLTIAQYRLLRTNVN